ncbi:hypothetical protein IWX46DRAFT_599885 [Phyllosticta citricarpa]|uniref:Secreted protein n=1 Tax=Phyllosticta citricarpa TaxID=55181 RepID=A0ABR1MD16_9PEZI
MHACMVRSHEQRERAFVFFFCFFVRCHTPCLPSPPPPPPPPCAIHTYIRTYVPNPCRADDDDFDAGRRRRRRRPV